MNTTWVQYDGWITAVTEKAFGVSKHGTATTPEIWIPRSQCRKVTYTDVGDMDYFVVGRIESLQLSVWYAEKEGLV